MSWGERSCTGIKCKVATPDKCNVDCPEYEHDGKTKPDSVSMKSGSGNQKQGSVNLKKIFSRLAPRCVCCDRNINPVRGQRQLYCGKRCRRITRGGKKNLKLLKKGI